MLVNIKDIKFKQKFIYKEELIQLYTNMILTQFGTQYPLLLDEDLNLLKGESTLLAAIAANKIDPTFTKIQVEIKYKKGLEQQLIDELQETAKLLLTRK